MTGAHEGALPDFIVIGAQKAGTTSLWHYLRSHPDAFLPEMKELNFFIAEGRWAKGIDWYRSNFVGRRPDQVAGEASPGYTMFPLYAGTPERMASVVPDARLVYLVREPVARMVSNWWQYRAGGLEHRDLRESLLMDLRYLFPSQYATQLERYLEYFGRSSLLVVRAEDLDDHPDRTMQEICTFIGLDPGRLNADFGTRLNRSDDKRIPRKRTLSAARLLYRRGRNDLAYKLVQQPRSWTHRAVDPSEAVVDDDLRERLTDYVRPEMVRLRAIVGPDFDLWGHA